MPCFNLKLFVDASLIRIPQTEIFYGINKINEIFEEEQIIMEKCMMMKVLEEAFVLKRGTKPGLGCNLLSFLVAGKNNNNGPTSIKC